MYITQKFLSRRTLLKGAGVTLALPFLDSMVPAQTPLAKTAANVAPRFMGIFSAHGWSPTYWADNRLTERPATEGFNVGLGFIHKPLEPFQDQLTICSGLDSTAVDAASRNERRRSCSCVGKSHGACTSQGDRATGYLARHQRRPDLLRKSTARRRLLPRCRSVSEDPGFSDGRVRLGLQLRLYQFDFLVGAESSAAS